VWKANTLEWFEHRRREQIFVPLVPASTYWYLSAMPELLELASRVDVGMSALASTLQAFFLTFLGEQCQAGPSTITPYRDEFIVLLNYARTLTGMEPTEPDLADLDASFVSGFRDDLERERYKSVRIRNARLATLAPSIGSPTALTSLLPDKGIVLFSRSNVLSDSTFTDINEFT